MDAEESQASPDLSGALAECVQKLACLHKDDGPFRDSFNTLAGIIRHGNHCLEECGNIHQQRMESDEVKKTIAGWIRDNIKDNQNAGKDPDKWDVSGELEKAVENSGEFGSDAWSTALYLLHPSQVFQLYRHSMGRINELRQKMNATMLYLPEQIDMLVCGAVAQEPVLLLGPPGSGKTRTAVEFFARLGLSDGGDGTGRKNGFFQYLLTKFTTPEEICGSFNIPAMYEGRMVRGRAGSITAPEIRAAFIDEVFKASSPILHSLLTLLSDRKYHSEGRLLPSDLSIIIMAANDAPYNDHDSAAIYDRMGLRLHFPEIAMESGHERPIKGGGEKTGGPEDYETPFMKVVERAWRREGFQLETSHGNLCGCPGNNAMCDLYDIEEKKEHWGLTKGDGSASINDILLLSRAMCLAPYKRSAANMGADFWAYAPSEEFFTRFSRIVEELYYRPYCRLSARKLKTLYKLARSHALLRNESLKGPEPKDCAVFRHVWESPEMIDEFRKGVDQYLD